MSPATRTVLWQFPSLPAMERCTLAETADGARLSGTVLVPLEGRPSEIRYTVLCGRDWRTRSAEVEVLGADAPRRMRMVADAGRWTLNGAPLAGCDGLIDIDLGFSPCTNTLPIRRLGLGIGDRADVTAVWMRYPTLDVLTLPQAYTRIGENRYRYESRGGEFVAELAVDDVGLVTTYGEYWRTIA